MPRLIPGPITAQRILDKPEREEDLGSVRDIGILDNNQLAHWSIYP